MSRTYIIISKDNNHIKLYVHKLDILFNTGHQPKSIKFHWDFLFILSEKRT